jgi:hypothetical protein
MNNVSDGCLAQRSMAWDGYMRTMDWCDSEMIPVKESLSHVFGSIQDAWVMLRWMLSPYCPSSSASSFAIQQFSTHTHTLHTNTAIYLLTRKISVTEHVDHTSAPMLVTSGLLGWDDVTEIVPANKSGSTKLRKESRTLHPVMMRRKANKTMFAMLRCKWGYLEPL